MMRDISRWPGNAIYHEGDKQIQQDFIIFCIGDNNDNNTDGLSAGVTLAGPAMTAP